MSSKTRTYAVRLTAEGERELKRVLKTIGKDGDVSLRRIHKASKKASGGLRGVNAASQVAQAGMMGLGRSVPAVERLARVLGATALVTGVVRFGTGALDAGRNFEAAMKRVQAATGATEKQIARLEEKARSAGESTPFKASDAANAIEVLAKNGLRYQEIMGGALDATLALSGALGGDLSRSADLVTDLMAQFSLQAGDLARITDLVTGAALNSKFGFDDMRLAIGQAGGVAGKFGIEIEDFLGGLSATASNFSSGQDAGTSFKNFLQRLTPQSKEAKEVFDQLGLAFFDAEGNMKSLAEIAGELEDGIAGLTEEARNAALVKAFGTDAVRTALGLADQGFEGVQQVGIDIRGVSASDQAQVRLEGLNGALQELASAWEAINITAAQSGGLEFAEDQVDRLTSAIRYLNENFSEVEEVVERVAQALTVYLVGRGLNVVVARGVAARAAMIDLATSVDTVGTASKGMAGKIKKIGGAVRVLTGALGGPVGLALTAASLAALAIDLDKAQDAVDRARDATSAGATAMDDYREATRLAAEEQEKFGGKVTEATAKILEQSRTQLQQALADSQAAYDEAFKSLNQGIVSHFDSAQLEIQPPPRQFRPDPNATQNPYLTGIVNSIEDLENGKKSVRDFMAEFDELRAIGDEFKEVSNQVKDLASEGITTGQSFEAAAEELMRLAENAGLFEDELEAIRQATSDTELQQAYRDLSAAVIEAMEAGSKLRSESLASFREMVDGLADAEQGTEGLRARLADLLETFKDLSTVNPMEALTQGAIDAAAAVETTTDTLASAYGEYGRTRSHSDRVTTARSFSSAAERGMLDLIGAAEGTDKGRGYNETLDYGAYTGGERNLVSMTLNEILALQKQMLAHPNNPHNSSALGRYQIVSKTLRGLMGELNLGGDELYDERLQDRLATQLLRRRQGQGVSGLRNEWEGLHRVSDTNIQTALGNTNLPSRDPTRAGEIDRARDLRIQKLGQERTAINDLVQTGEHRRQQLEFEQSIMGKSVEEQTRLRFIFEATNEAKRQGIDIDTALSESGETLRQSIERQAQSVASLAAEEARHAEAKRRFEQEAQGARGALDGLLDKLIDDPKNAMEAFGGLMDYMRKRLWKLALDPVFDALANKLGSWMVNGLGFGLGFADGGALPARANGGALPAFADGGSMPAMRLVQGLSSQPAFADGSLQIGGRAEGRLQGIGSTRQDNILFMGSRGEYMVNAAATEHYGTRFMDLLNARQLPKFANGGALDRASSGQMPNLSAPNQTLIGSMSVVVESKGGNGSADEQAQELGRAIVERIPQMIKEELGEEMRDDGMLGKAFHRKGM